MATTLSPDVPVMSTTWLDLTTIHASLANAEAILQVKGSRQIDFVFGGTSAPADGASGITLEPLGYVRASGTANIWARGVGGGGIVSVTLA